jgi:putative sterol carrier protein
MTAKQLLHRMPAAFDASAAGDLSATIQYDISEPVHHVLEDGELRAVDGPADAPDLTIALADDDLLGLFQGRLDPLSAFMTGRVKVTGDMVLAQRLLGLFDLTQLSEATARIEG